MEQPMVDEAVAAALRAAAMAGDKAALRAWRVMNGYAEVPVFDPPSGWSWYWDGSGFPNDDYLEPGDPMLSPAGRLGRQVSARASGSDVRRSALWGQVAAMEEAFDEGQCSEGCSADEWADFVDVSPAEARARAAAFRAVEAARARLEALAEAGRSRRELVGYRAELARREAALLRLAPARPPEPAAA